MEPSGWAVKKKGEMSLNMPDVAGLVKPARPAVAFQ